MSQEKNQLFEEFENEMWLYLDKDLSEERMEFWNNKLKEIPELKNMLDEYYVVSDAYNKVKEVNLTDEKFNSFVDAAISKTSLLQKISTALKKIFSTDSEFAFGKIAFASVLIIMAVVISFLSNRPNPVVNLTNSINNEILEWDPDFVDDQITKVGNLLKVAKDDQYRKYYRYKLGSSNVDKNLNLINRNN